MNNEIMSEEAFYELVDVLDIVSGLTIYGRKSLKYWINKIVAENKRQQKQIDLMAEQLIGLPVNKIKQDFEKPNFKAEITIFTDKEDIKQYFERKSDK